MGHGGASDPLMARLIRGLGSLAVLVVGLAGVTIALAVLGGDPRPRELTWGAALHSLLTPVDGMILVSQHLEAPAIEPLVQEKCQSCHRAGGIAPFPLVTYEDVNIEELRREDSPDAPGVPEA